MLNRVLVAAILAALPMRLAAQHQHHPPAKADSARRDTSAAARGDSMAAMPGMAHGEHASAMATAMAMMVGPLGVSHTRMGSGTSWLPDSSPMHASHKLWGDWLVMFHGVAFLEYDKQYTRRGDEQLGIVDWEMAMAMRRVGRGLLHLHGMASLEPATIGARGYPLLLQTGESYKGRPLVDRQHPHDLFMELAAMLEQPLAPDVAVSLYAGAVGEPALGPVAFMHRPSAQSDPFAPLGHHWQDATHISYGVATAGVYSRRWKLEGSVFNGREPDENRWDFDFAPLDSYSGRLTVNPSGRWSLAGWYGVLESPEALHPGESTRRYGTSALYSGRGWRGGEWATLVMWGANDHGGRVENSAVVESNLELGRRNTAFGRYEYVRKRAEDLAVAGAPPDRGYDINSLVAGYVREVGSVPGATMGVGLRGSVGFIPRALEPAYGTRTPAGVAVYFRIRPKRMTMGGAMSGMPTPDMPASRDSTSTMHMQHDSASATPARRDSTPGMPMRPDSMSGMRDSSAMRRDSSTMRHVHADSSGTEAPRDTAAAHRHTPVKTRAAAPARKPATGPTKRKPAPPHHQMPGMDVPKDSTRKPPDE